MLKRFALVLLSILVFSAVSQAAIVVTMASLSAANENPTNSSPATGFTTVTLDTVLQTLRVEVTFSGLTGNPTGAHIHCCIAPGGNAAVATTVPTFPNFPVLSTSGSYDMTLDLTSSLSYNPAFVTAQGSLAAAEATLISGISGGTTYLNLHTAANGGGEIRGFLLATPEPGTIALMAAGMCGLLLARRRVTR
jgi:CHRD domain/PEP-CTERM motif